MQSDDLRHRRGGRRGLAPPPRARRSGGAARAVPWRRACCRPARPRRGSGDGSGLLPAPGRCGGSCRQEASRNWASPSGRSALAQLCCRSKQQLALAAEREWILKQSNMQTELNWQQLCENAECNWYQKSEDPTCSLCSSREEIFQHDDESSLCKYNAALEIKKLQEQNANLRAAIAQMREEMESLNEQMLSSVPQTEDRQLAEQGSLSTNKISTGTTLSNTKICSTMLDCIVNPDTEEELQCTRQQHPSRLSSLTACPSLKEEEAPSSCGEETELPSSEVWIDFSIENHGPDTSTKIVQTQLLSQSPNHVQQVQLSSSRTHNFCQILDTGPSLFLLSPQKNTSQGEFEVVHSIKQSEEPQQNVKAKDKCEASAEDLTVRGARLEVQQKLKSRSLSCAHLLKPKISYSMAKIRNYNIKD
ncbi:coiled-coil domain-containing protein 57 isoform X7 [Taeniopygia guttata]|uniref:coiled-coil domain-containing protein 57 isoform X7 n=1 Tax=Taeniopygia guttata TaxID=59729 RepID=UPI003BB883D9